MFPKIEQKQCNFRCFKCFFKWRKLFYCKPDIFMQIQFFPKTWELQVSKKKLKKHYPLRKNKMFLSLVHHNEVNLEAARDGGQPQFWWGWGGWAGCFNPNHPAAHHCCPYNSMDAYQYFHVYIDINRTWHNNLLAGWQVLQFPPLGIQREPDLLWGYFPINPS